MSLYRKYARTIHRHTGYRATWVPGAPMRLGDVGTIENGVFTYATRLDLLGIPYEENRADVPDDAFSFTSSGVRDVKTKLEGATDERFEYVAEAKAGIRVDFSGKDAVVVHTKQARTRRIDNVASLDAALLRLVKEQGADGQPTWKREWVVITEVIEAKAATVLTSLESDAAIEIEASGALGPDGLVDADAGLASKWSRSVGVEVIAKRGLTPFYKARRIKPKWLWLWGAEVAPADAVPPQDGSDLFEDDVADLDETDEADAGA